jgi:TonB family protein
MYAAILVVSTLFVPGQDATDATELLTKVVNAARSAKSWRVEGQVTVENGVAEDSQSDFKLSWRRPDLERFESDGTSLGRRLDVCDGATLWSYFFRTNHYTMSKRLRDENASDAVNCEWISRCSAPIGHWQNLLTGLGSATFIGHDTIGFDGQSRECENVRAEYPPKSTSRLGPRIRTMCIDAERLLILRERLETARIGSGNSPIIRRVETTTYSAIERDAELDDYLFVFKPPPDSTVTDLGAFKGVADVSPPVPIYRPDPKYPKKTARKKIEGTVILSIVVDTDGSTRDIRVVRPLDPDLDESAVECVSTWKFKPGEKDGQPVKVMAQIEVNFLLLHNR